MNVEEGEVESTGSDLRQRFTITLQHFRVGEASVPSFPITWIDPAKQVHTHHVAPHAFVVESLLANLAGVEAIHVAAIDDTPAGDTYDRLATQARIGYILNGYSSLRGLVSIDLIAAGGRHYHVGDTLEAARLDERQRLKLFDAALRSGRPVHWSGIGPNINVHSAYRKVITAARLLYRVERETLRREPAALLLVSYDPGELARQFDGVALGNGAWFVIVDDDVDIRSWQEVIWAITTRMDPVRDTTLVDHTPIDYLDFASPVSGLGGKMGLDATNKWPGETDREWGRVITMPKDVTDRVEGLVQHILGGIT